MMLQLRAHELVPHKLADRHRQQRHRNTFAGRERACRGTRADRDWPTLSWPSPRARHAAHRPASASRWRCSRWRFASSAATPSASPAASRASSPTIGTSTRASSRCGRSASRTSSRAERSSSSPATRACRTASEVTTLGRGGSDTTAVAMAAALDAEYCEICSDVDGVYSADPRVVPAARRIGTLSYEETQEMAEAGAKVLNAQAVEFAKEKGIAIYARATAAPLPGADPSADGTVVRQQSAADARHRRRRRQRTRRARARRRTRRRSTCSRCSTSARVAGKQLHVFGDRATLVISRENLHDEGRVCATRCDAPWRPRASRSTAWPRSASSAPASTRPTRTCAPAPRRWRRRDRAGRDRDLVVPNHVDGAARPHGRGRACAARALHRVAAAAAAVEEPSMTSDPDSRIWPSRSGVSGAHRRAARGERRSDADCATARQARHGAPLGLRGASSRQRRSARDDVLGCRTRRGTPTAARRSRRYPGSCRWRAGRPAETSWQNSSTVSIGSRPTTMA